MDELLEEAKRIQDKYSEEEILKATINNVQYLVSSVIPFQIPPIAIQYLERMQLGTKQLEVLQMIGVKLIAYTSKKMPP